MFLSFLILALLYLTISFGWGIFFHYVLKKTFLGGFWGYTILGIVGSTFGGLLELLSRSRGWISGTVQRLPYEVLFPLLASGILLWIASGFYNAKDD